MTVLGYHWNLKTAKEVPGNPILTKLRGDFVSNNDTLLALFLEYGFKILGSFVLLHRLASGLSRNATRYSHR